MNGYLEAAEKVNDGLTERLSAPPRLFTGKYFDNSVSEHSHGPQLELLTQPNPKHHKANPQHIV